MPQFSVNTTRLDPYKNFKFLVYFEGKTDPVAGLSKVSALKRTTEVIRHRDGGSPSSSLKGPGRSEYEAITLERGVTHDTDFEAWANRVWNYANAVGKEIGLKNFRRNMIIKVLNEAGQAVLSYKIYRCWVSEYQALSELDANGNGVLIQLLKVENEGWERDPDVVEAEEFEAP